MSLHLWEGSGISYMQDLTWKCLKGLVDAVTSLLKRVCMFTYINHITAVCYFEKKKKKVISIITCICYTKIVGGQQIFLVTAHSNRKPQQIGFNLSDVKTQEPLQLFQIKEKKASKNIFYIQTEWLDAHDFTGWVSDCKTRGFPATGMLDLVPISLVASLSFLGFLLPRSKITNIHALC